MEVEDFYVPVGVIDPEFDGIAATDVDRNGSAGRVCLIVVRTSRGMIANGGKAIAEIFPVGLGQAFDEADDIVVDEEPEGVHVGGSVRLGAEAAVEIFEGRPTG